MAFIVVENLKWKGLDRLAFAGGVLETAAHNGSAKPQRTQNAAKHLNVEPGLLLNQGPDLKMIDAMSQ